MTIRSFSLRYISYLFAIVAMGCASALHAQQQGIVEPSPPALPTDFAQCEAFSSRYSDYLKALRLSVTECYARLDRQAEPSVLYRDAVAVKCEVLTWPRFCVPEIQRSACAHQNQISLLSQCRAAVRHFKEGANTKADVQNVAPVDDDYRDALLSPSIDAANGATIETLGNLIGFPGDKLRSQVKKFVGSANLMRKSLEAITDPSASTQLALGQEFGKLIYGQVGASSMAKALFGAASKATTNTAGLAIDDVSRMLNAFDADYDSPPPASDGIEIPGVNQTAPAPPALSGTQYRPKKRQCENPNGRRTIDEGAYICDILGDAHRCDCSGTSCSLTQTLFTDGCRGIRSYDQTTEEGARRLTQPGGGQ